jgi:hypothetical protein
MVTQTWIFCMTVARFRGTARNPSLIRTDGCEPEAGPEYIFALEAFRIRK